ncbi:hypothetical protein BDF14DRAFT_1845770 [Spinellus fusiger]|nr:hypothetical protein BDF14DRAFT_1845770 [Spinellus fusiger]
MTNIKVIAHHTYEAQREDELSFSEHSTLVVTDTSDADWWLGTKEDGTSGYFPSNFVQPIEEEIKETVLISSQEEQDTAEQEKKPAQPLGMARVMEDYAMQAPEELTLHKGSIITVYEKTADGWMRGENNGKMGRFPAKYVEEIDIPGRPDFGISTTVAHSEGSEDSEEVNRPAFKLAAFGIKQGGIGSLLAGGFPSLKKAGSPKKTSPEESSSETSAAFLPPPKIPEPSSHEVSQTHTSTEVYEEHTPKEQVEEKTSKHTDKPTPKPSLGKAIVLHPYDAENSDELGLLRGEYVDILDRHADDGWWEGKNERGATGVFPSNFVKEIEEESTAPPAPVRSRKSVTSVGSQQSFNSPQLSGGFRLPPLPSNSSRSPSIISNASGVGRPSSLLTEQQVSQESPVQPEPITPDVTLAAIHESMKLPLLPNTKELNASVYQEKEEKSHEEKEPEKVIKPIPTEDEPTSPLITTPTATTISPVVPSVLGRPSIPSRPQSLLSETVMSPKTESISEETSDAVSSQISSEEKPEETVASPNVSNDIYTPEPEGIEQAPIEQIPEEEVQEASDEVPENTQDTTDTPNGVNTSTQETEELVTPKEETRDFSDLPSGPKLTAPTRARPTKARRAPQTPNLEPSQTEILQKELEQAPDEIPVTDHKETSSPEKTTPLLPVKPSKPIFNKFPTPFSVGAEDIAKTNLKPVQRRMWEPVPAYEPKETKETKEEQEEQAPRPAGVKNIASRFQFGGVSTGGNEVLETKLKNFAKTEIEKVKKDLEKRLEEERERREQLEALVQTLLARVEQLESQ